MALWNIYVRKAAQGEEWGNTYHVDAGSIEAAIDAGNMIVDFEKSIHYDIVSFLQLRVSDTIVGTNVFASIPISGTGAGTSGSDDLPILLTLNVAIVPVGFGSPSRKYYHLGAGEDAQAAGVWSSGLVSAVLGAFETFIADLNANGTPLVDPDGQEWNTAIVRTKVGRHKFSKASRRIAPTP